MSENETKSEDGNGGLRCNDGLGALVKLRKKIRTHATKAKGKVKNDATHFEGFNKGLWLAYEDAATWLDGVIRKIGAS